MFLIVPILFPSLDELGISGILAASMSCKYNGSSTYHGFESHPLRQPVLGILSVPSMLAETLKFGPNHMEFARRAFSLSGDSPRNVQADRDILLRQSRGALPYGSSRIDRECYVDICREERRQ